MSKGREIRCYDYVNYSYDKVRDALKENALAVFQAATKGAASRANSVAAELRVNIGGVEVAKDISISVNRIEEGPGTNTSAPTTRLQLEWEATESPGLFPLMTAELAIYPLSSSETQLDFAGEYEPPMGVVGGAIDTVIGHRVAEASIHRFVSDVAAYLRSNLDESSEG